MALENATLGVTGSAAPSGGDDAHVTVGPIEILGIPEETAQLVASLKDPEESTSGGIRVILGKRLVKHLGDLDF